MFGHTNDPLILSPLEHAGPRGYVRPILCFALDPSADQDEVVRILKAGLDATKEQVPYLSAEVVEDTEAEQKGCLTLREGDFGELRVRTLSKAEFPLSYEEFRAKNFPTDQLHQDVVSPTSVFPQPGSQVPVFLAQANFVEGGLLLSVAVYHLVADGFSICRLLRIWAQSCRKLQDPNSTSTVFLSSSAFERAPLVVGHLSDPDKCNIADHPELVLTDMPPINRMPSTARRYRTHVWHLSPSALQRLRHDASAGPGRKVSAADALTALIWRATVAAQQHDAADTETSAATSILTIPVASRARTFPPLAPDYMGCPLVYANPTHALAEIVTNDAVDAVLPALARKVKAAVDAVTPHYVSTVVNMFNKVPDYVCLAPASFAGLAGPHAMVSSWEKYDAYAEDWGSLFGGRCDRWRTVSEGMMNGVQLVLPALPGKEGGVEVAMGLEEGREEVLARDEVWTRYAVRVD
ncbi:hypothetical protein SLS56_011229 [Neofusicoccum ribis]|uniref:Uncharacterized protein n=1 Tax=Neofusicoccum ribis TaxID=45134 RepID=A0ABR3SC54_9PEZI